MRKADKKTQIDASAPINSGAAAKTVLIVEDEEKIARVIVSAFERSGFQADWINNGDDGLRAALEGRFDLLVLDVLLPGKTGFEIIEALRRAGSNALVLMLTSLNEIDNWVKGLSGGADDYLAKPFYTEELLLRAEALLRRAGRRTMEDSGAISKPEVRVKNLRLHRLRREVTVDDKIVDLTLREFDLLEYLLREPGAVRPRAKIFKALWNYGPGARDHILEVYIGRLRNRLAEAGASGIIETVRGVGYRIAVPDSNGSR